jgi:hypothetical protein
MRVTNWSGAMGFVLDRGYGRPRRIGLTVACSSSLQTAMQRPRPLVTKWAYGHGAVVTSLKHDLSRRMRDNFSGCNLGSIWEDGGQVLPHIVRSPGVGLLSACSILKHAH